MTKPNICLCLMAKTLEEDAALARHYAPYIDMVELRADFLDNDERTSIRGFPAMCSLPVILTIRRKCDGGNFVEGEAARTSLFARALAFSDYDGNKKFDYVDFEEDFRISGLQDACLSFGIKIIRSFHNIEGNLTDIQGKLEALKKNPYEIPKIAFTPQKLSDVTQLFRVAKTLENSKQILCAMGSYATVGRVLCGHLNSFIAFCTPKETAKDMDFLGHIDPVTLCDMYRIKQITASTKLFCITGFPLKATSSPLLHNKGYKKNDIDAVFFPLKADSVQEAIEFAKEVGIKGMSVTVPHKEAVLQYLSDYAPQVREVGACNTVVFDEERTFGYNTDTEGFMKALLEFMGGKKNILHKKTALIGAGGAARAVVWVLHELGAKVCIFNRTISKAKLIADQFGFKYASLGPESIKMLSEYSPLIVQTTAKGMGATEPSCEENDPLWFYGFSGKEKLVEVIYTPDVTPVMARAQAQGCTVTNGYKMLLYQAQKQFEYFTGTKATLE